MTSPVKKKRPGRRTRYNTKKREVQPDVLSSIGITPEVRDEKLRAMVANFEAESRVKGRQARRVLSESLAAGALLFQDQTRLHAAGILTADEARAIPSLLRAVAKLAELAAVTLALDGDTCRECSGNGELADGSMCIPCEGSGVEP